MSEDAHAQQSGRPMFWIGVTLGWAFIVFGLWGVLHNARASRPPQWSAWFVGAAVLHDGVIAPLVIGVGALVVRRLRGPARAVVQGALVATGIVVLVTLPNVLHVVRSSNPTLLPNNYAAGLFGVVAIIWVTAGALIAVSGVRDIRR